MIVNRTALKPREEFDCQMSENKVRITELYIRCVKICVGLRIRIIIVVNIFLAFRLFYNGKYKS